MKIFVLKVIAFVIIFFVLATLLQNIIDRGLRKAPENKEINDIISSDINAGILIQGSSRAKRHISTLVLDSVFKMNSYNLGLPAYNFIMQYYQFLLYLKYNTPPKYIIQNIDPRTFRKDRYLVNYEQFLPFLDDRLIKKAVVSYHGLDWKDFYIPLYKYHSVYHLVYEGIKNNISKPQPDNNDHKGYEPIDSLCDPSFGSYLLNNPQGYRMEVDSLTLNYFKSFIDTCKAKKITVILVYTPEYYRAQKMLLNRDSIISLFKNYSSLYNLTLLDYSQDSICHDSVNFYNYQHLNKIGVKKFNSKLARDLKDLIK